MSQTVLDAGKFSMKRAVRSWKTSMAGREAVLGASRVKRISTRRVSVPGLRAVIVMVSWRRGRLEASRIWRAWARRAEVVVAAMVP